MKGHLLHTEYNERRQYHCLWASLPVFRHGVVRRCFVCLRRLYLAGAWTEVDPPIGGDRCSVAGNYRQLLVDGVQRLATCSSGVSALPS